MESKMGGIWATKDLGDCNKTDFFKLRFSPLFIYFYLGALGLSCGMWDPYILVTAYGI